MLRKSILVLAAGLLCSSMLHGVALASVTGPIWGQSVGSENLIGSRESGGGGVVGSAAWDNGDYDISWNITNNDNKWTYTYTVKVDRKDVSHFLLEVTNDGNPFNVLEGSDVNIVQPATVYSSGTSNPNMPNSLYGIKFDFGGNLTTYTIVTDRAPVWGVFYAKDGKDGGVAVTAWSNALNYDNYQTSMTLTETDFIVRPDGVGSGVNGNPVPVPGAAWLLGSGLLGLAGLGRRKKVAVA